MSLIDPLDRLEDMRVEAILFAEWLWLNVDENEMSKRTWSDLYEDFKNDSKFNPTNHTGL